MHITSTRGRTISLSSSVPCPACGGANASAPRVPLEAACCGGSSGTSCDSVKSSFTCTEVRPTKQYIPYYFQWIFGWDRGRKGQKDVLVRPWMPQRDRHIRSFKGCVMDPYRGRACFMLQFLLRNRRESRKRSCCRQFVVRHETKHLRLLMSR